MWLWYLAPSQTRVQFHPACLLTCSGPCCCSLEFSEPEFAYVKSESSIRVRGTNQANYIDNRYWTMYKLPMFGCTDPSQVRRQPLVHP